MLAALASILSGESVARGAPVVPIAVQAMRSLVPALLLLAWPGAPLWLVAVALPVGEAARGAVLAGVVPPGAPCAGRRRAPRTSSTPHGLLAQATSQGVTQLGPAVDRVFLSSSGAGYISSYEMSDRLFYAATQFFTLTFLYRRVAIWARLPTMEPDDARHLLRRDAPPLGVVVTVLTVAGMLGAWSRWRRACSARLDAGLLVGRRRDGSPCPPMRSTSSGTRLLVVARKQHYMVGIAVATAVLNAVLDTGLYFSAGADRDRRVDRRASGGPWRGCTWSCCAGSSRDHRAGAGGLSATRRPVTRFRGLITCPGMFEPVRIRAESVGVDFWTEGGSGPTASAGRVAKNVRLDFFGRLSALPFRSGTGADA